ncbi:MAG: class I SAM-dependent methyltransferase [Phycisphaeraceae bacterium]|nr:class I SAM-dependent methyltransferase [Phycisphaeraceae bacterium]MCW5755198.1 class I SAM-dependent methyltransferase [Phycisphaeraceae bacterium]
MSITMPAVESTPGVAFYAGAVAEVYDLLFPPDCEQVDEAFFARHIVAGEGPALEIASGTGRLLLRLLARGLPVEGLELSADMLRICRERASKREIPAVLHHASMVDFSLGRQFATVFVPFYSFQILTDRSEAECCLRSLYNHTAPGGKTMLTTWTHWEDMLPAGERGEKPWKLVRTGRDDDRGLFVTSSAASEVNRTEQLQTNWFRYDVYQHGRLVETTSRIETIRFYHKYELQMMMERAGFVDVRVTGDETDEPATDAHTSWVVTGYRR